MPESPARVVLLCGTRHANEDDPAVLACNDWLLLGPGRSLRKLLAQYTTIHQNTPPVAPPTASLDTLKRWSRLYDWQGRKTLYDAQVTGPAQAAVGAEVADRQRAIAQAGLARMEARLAKLERLADWLETLIYEEGEDAQGEPTYPNVFLPDVKGIGSGPDFERVDLERLNPALLREYRATLADIAKEVGGRRGPVKAPAITLEMLLEALPDEFRSAVRQALTNALSAGDD